MGMICYDSTLALDHQHSINEQSSQKRYIQKLIYENMNENSIYVPNIEQQYVHEHEDMYMNVNGQGDQSGFFRFWMKNYEECQYLLRRKKYCGGEVQEIGMGDRVWKLKEHCKQLEASIQQLTQRLIVVRKQNSHDHKATINFQLNQIMFKDTKHQSTISSIQVQVNLRANHNDEKILLNSIQTNKIDLQGEHIKINNGITIRQSWIPFKNRIKITLQEQYNNSTMEAYTNLQKIIQSITIKINVTQQKYIHFSTTLPINKQLFKHRYPFKQMVKISSSLSSGIKNPLQETEQHQQYGVIVFRIENISSNEQQNIKQLIQFCKTRKNVIKNEIDNIQNGRLDELDMSLTLKKMADSFYSQEAIKSFR